MTCCQTNGALLFFAQLALLLQELQTLIPEILQLKKRGLVNLSKRICKWQLSHTVLRPVRENCTNMIYLCNCNLIEEEDGLDM